jgi:RimJ/RimL family protein N-acetyltransferase
MIPAQTVRLEPWASDDLGLLSRLLGDPAMTAHLGGPETPGKITERHARFLTGAPGEQMFRITVEPGDGAGSIGYWEREWRGERIYETGWFVLPELQGRGIAQEATRLVIAAAASECRNRWLHAFPSVDNAPSNAICSRLGFELVEEVDFEYPPGSRMRCNDWRIALTAAAPR